jgi:hypothetical protein
MIERTEERLGLKPQRLAADSAYRLCAVPAHLLPTYEKSSTCVRELNATQKKLDRRTRELSGALDQQKATSRHFTGHLQLAG